MRVAFVGSYVPRRCGIATFTADKVSSVTVVSHSLRLRGATIDR